MLRSLILKWLFRGQGYNEELLLLLGDRRWHDSIRLNLQALGETDKGLHKRIEIIEAALGVDRDAA